MKTARCWKTILCQHTRNFYCQNFGRNLRNQQKDQEQVLNLSPKELKKKQLIEIEMQVERDNGNYFIPDQVEDKYWKELLNKKTPNERKYFFRYLKKTELYERKDKERHHQKVLQNKQELEKRIKQYGDHIQYGLWHNYLFLRVKPGSKSSINNLRDAVLFGQKLVIDLGYEDRMNYQEINNTVQELVMCHSANRINKEPFYLHFCNANMNGQLVQKLKSSLSFLQKPHPLINLTEESYLNLFPIGRLVYLTPHCDDELRTYSHDDIYIIGGIVDKNRQGPVSLAKAKQDGIRMARLPLERYLDWQGATTNLNIEQVVKILLTMKDTMDWKKALQHVPTRKIRSVITNTFFFRKPRNNYKNDNEDK